MSTINPAKAAKLREASRMLRAQREARLSAEFRASHAVPSHPLDAGPWGPNVTTADIDRWRARVARARAGETRVDPPARCDVVDPGYATVRAPNGREYRPFSGPRRGLRRDALADTVRLHPSSDVEALYRAWRAAMSDMRAWLGSAPRVEEAPENETDAARLDRLVAHDMARDAWRDELSRLHGVAAAARSDYTTAHSAAMAPVAARAIEAAGARATAARDDTRAHGWTLDATGAWVLPADRQERAIAAHGERPIAPARTPSDTDETSAARTGTDG